MSVLRDFDWMWVGLVATILLIYVYKYAFLVPHPSMYYRGIFVYIILCFYIKTTWIWLIRSLYFNYFIERLWSLDLVSGSKTRKKKSVLLCWGRLKRLRTVIFPCKMSLIRKKFDFRSIVDYPSCLYMDWNKLETSVC